MLDYGRAVSAECPGREAALGPEGAVHSGATLGETTWRSSASKHGLIGIKNAKVEILWWSLKPFKYKLCWLYANYGFKYWDKRNSDSGNQEAGPIICTLKKEREKSPCDILMWSFEKLWCSLLVLFPSGLLGDLQASYDVFASGFYSAFPSHSS